MGAEQAVEKRETERESILPVQALARCTGELTHTSSVGQVPPPSLLLSLPLTPRGRDHPTTKTIKTTKTIIKTIFTGQRRREHPPNQSLRSWTEGLPVTTQTGTRRQKRRERKRRL